MNSNETKNIAYLIFAGVGIYFISKFGKGVLDKLNITQSKEEKEAMQLVESTPDVNPFNPGYYKTIKPKGNKKKIHLMKSSFALQFSKDIRDAIGYLTSDYTKILNVFQKLKYKSQVSFLCETFSKKYGDNLFEYIKSGYKLPIGNTGLSEKQMDSIIKYVNNLPSGLY